MTQDNIHAKESNVNSLQPWSNKGLAGRGVLIDYASYAERQGISVAHFAPHGITIDDVKAVAAEQGVTFQTGDVLFLRTGYVKAYQASSEERKKEISSVREWCGLSQGRETTKWLWERQFAALVSDSPGCEVRRECFPNGLT